MPVFFLPPECITPPAVSVSGDLLTHLRDSLRITVGEIVLFADGDQHRYRTEITAISKQGMTGRVLDVIHSPLNRSPSLVLGQALIKGEKMAWAIQKATELGVRTIVPLQTRQSIIQVKSERVDSQIARWNRIALEAAQQSEQWRVPTVAPPCSVASYLRQLPAHTLALILVERHDQIESLAKVALPDSPEASILVLVGPEGGWTAEEVTGAERAGCIPVTFGSRILRAETAALLAIGILQYRIGGLG